MIENWKRHRTAYLVAVFCPLASFYLLTVSALWQVYELTASMASTGWLSLFQFLPALILYPWVGHASDRWDKRRILQLTTLGGTLLSFALIAVSGAGRLQATGLFAAVAGLSALRSFEATALAAWLPELVPQSDLPRTIALVAGLKQVAKIGGPATAGGLLLLNPQGLWVYVLMAIFGTAAGLALLTTRSGPKAETARPARPSLKETWRGLGYVFSSQILAGALLLDLTAGLLGGFTALLPVFAKEILHTDAAGAGTLRSMIAVGSLAGSLVIAALPIRLRVGRLLVASVGLVGLVTVCLALTEQFAVAAGLVAIFGALDSISVNIRQTLIQVATPYRLRGRVSATSQLFILVSNQLGEFRAAMMGALLGAVPSVALGGTCAVAAAALWSRWFPKLTELNRFDEAASPVRTPVPLL